MARSQEPSFRESSVWEDKSYCAVPSAGETPKPDREEFCFETVCPFLAKLAWDVLCSSLGWSRSGSSCCHLPSAGITGVHHHTKHPSGFFFIPCQDLLTSVMLEGDRKKTEPLSLASRRCALPILGLGAILVCLWREPKPVVS